MECVGDFLRVYAPKINEKNVQENNAQTEKTFLQEFDDNLRRESVMIVSQCSAWYILVTSKLGTSLRLPTSDKVYRRSQFTALIYGYFLRYSCPQNLLFYPVLS